LLIIEFLDLSKQLVKITIIGSNRKTNVEEFKLLSTIIKDKTVVKRTKVIDLLLSLFLTRPFHI
jgi:hypothetical protein